MILNTTLVLVLVPVEIISICIEKLNNVDRSIEIANGLPNECYTNANYLAHEREKMAMHNRIQSE